MLVMQEPIKTSSIGVLATSESKRASSGSFGAQTTGSVISLRSISMTAAYSASGSAESSDGLDSHASISAMRRSSVSAFSYPCLTIQRSRAALERRYCATLSSDRRITQAAADRSAEASASSNACSALSVSSPSISRIRPEKILRLFFFSTVNRPCFLA